jgi:hypothetical protein
MTLEVQSTDNSGFIRAGKIYVHNLTPVHDRAQFMFAKKTREAPPGIIKWFRFDK